MEGLKLIAQATFDKHQKFRPSPASSSSEGSGPYRYSVIEVGAFTPSSSSLKRQSSSSLANSNHNAAASSGTGSGSRPQNGATRTPRITMNEWMVHEEDLGAFMRKRPVDVVTFSSGEHTATAHERLRSVTQNTKAASNTTKASTNTHSGRTQHKEEVEAVASLKLVCIQRAEPDSDDTESANAHPYTLAISRETFLRLYVDIMDADHHALYYMVRQYDGFHEFNDQSKTMVTKFLGTSHYALIWTFNRKTLETRALFLDRCQTWQTKDTTAVPATLSHSNSVPVTPIQRRLVPQDISLPSTPSKDWTRTSSQPNDKVVASDAWRGFKDTLKVYRGYIFAPQMLSFVACVNMLRSFDDQVTDEDLPLLKDVETNLSSVAQSAIAQPETVPRLRSNLAPTQTSSFAMVSEQPPNPFAPSTPPSEGEKHLLPAPTQPLDRQQKLLSQTLALGTVDARLANKLRHLTLAKHILTLLAREHETVLADVVPQAFLDRYHWVMEGMTEAVPALEQHAASLEAYLRYLKGRSERLSGLISTMTSLPLSTRSIIMPGSCRLQEGQQLELHLPILPKVLQSSPLLRDDHQAQAAAAAVLQVGKRDVAVATVASMPAIFSAATIAIVSVRFSWIVPSLVLLFYRWLLITQREWLEDVRKRRTAQV